MYIIKSFERYYIRDDGKFLIETYNPNLATIFNTVEDANDFSLCCNAREYFEVVELEKEISTYNKWMSKGMIRRRLQKIDRKVSRKYNGEGIKDIIKFFISQQKNENLISYNDYKTWPELYTKSKHLVSVDRYEKDKICFTIKIPKNGELRNFRDEIELCIPFTTYIEDGYYVFSIMDHELNQFESRYLCVNEELTHGFIMNSRHSLIYDKDILENCFSYMKYRFYYE